MTIDFTTGLATSSYDDASDVFQLMANPNNHFMLDVCHHLTRGHTRQDGHARVKVKPGNPEEDRVQEVHVLDLHAVQFDVTVCDGVLDDHELRQSRQRLLRIHTAAQELGNSRLNVWTLRSSTIFDNFLSYIPA